MVAVNVTVAVACYVVSDARHKSLSCRLHLAL
jgi:hypothetical protein